MKKLLLIICLLLFVSAFAQKNLRPAPGNNTSASTFKSYDFNPNNFKQPSISFGPMTRWWWPGNDVTKPELQREIKLFASNGFAGVEVQPFFEGLNAKGPEDQLKRQFSWDTPSFYEHLRVVLEQAKQSGIIVDVNAGSGWPMGGPQISPDSSLLTLAYADTLINGGQAIKIEVPKLKQSSFTVAGNSAFPFIQTVPISYAKLQTVIAAKVVKKDGRQTFLDSSSVQDMMLKVTDGMLSWQVPEGNWQIISFWSMPDGELPKSIAARPKGFVVDHLDSNKLKASYTHLFGTRTGLQPYFGSPLRAVFNDSYEFMPDRHYAENFLRFFKEKRGYDIAPFLPVNMKRFYNNAYIAPMTATQPFDFVYSDEDWRLRYDYDLTVSELLQSQFILQSNRWLNNNRLLHRTQAYGVRMDVVGGSGKADIPEVEQLAGANTEGFLKLVTSGAHLYNKPLITEEAFVFRGLAEMTTPQKIRLLADKSFAAGVNQLIYHGTPYKYQTGEFGKEGWSPFSSPLSPGNNFSSTINESSPFWNDIKNINNYIARSQYLLQSGKPIADVLIYFPFNDFYPEQATPNTNEILISGNFEGVEPKTASTGRGGKEDGTQKWFAALWPLINKLEAAGITWNFVNDDALQIATVQEGKININGNAFPDLVLANLPFIDLKSAEKVSELSKAGAHILVYGEAPGKQPSYLNYKEHDAKTKELILGILKDSYVKQITDQSGLDSWLKQLTVKLKFTKEYDFTRSNEREMSDGSRIKFIWNQSNQWQSVSITADTEIKNFYWLDAESGRIMKINGASISYVLPPYNSVFLLATKKKLPEILLSSVPLELQRAKDVLELKTWTVKIGDTTLNHSSLFDWKSENALKYKSDKGAYTISFNLDKQNDKKYILDLGTVYYTADVTINGKLAGKRLWAPYQLEITSFLKNGNNTVKVQVTPTYRNEFIGEAIKGNPKYAQFKRKENTLMPAGLVGPVHVIALPGI